LAVAAADGRVALAALPGALDVLGGEVPGFAPGRWLLGWGWG
jgi:hypothetical protein